MTDPEQVVEANLKFYFALESLDVDLMDEVWATDATSYFSRPGPRVVDGVEILAQILHPEVFGPPTDDQAVRVPARKTT